MCFRLIQIFVAMLMITTRAQAHNYQIGELHIMYPYARVTMAGQSGGVAYLMIENKGKQYDKLVGLITPIAQMAEIHTMSMEGNVMRMREATSIDLPPLSSIAMRPGNGYHIMLIGLSQPLKAGDEFPLILKFAKAGMIKVFVHVEAIDAKNHAIGTAAETHQQR